MAAETAGVRRLVIPTPFAIGDVNAWLIEGDRLTLVDCGPNWATSYLALERALEPLGYRIADLDLVLITHQHLDHLGLTEIVVAHSGAEVGCLARLAPYVREFTAAAGRDDDLAVELMGAHGVDSRTARDLRKSATLLRRFGSSFDPTLELAPGAVVDLGSRRLEVAARPGHSPSDTVFVDPDRAVAFGGDHLLVETSSNPIIAHPLPPAAPATVSTRPRPLLDYVESLAATRALGLETIFPGHGPPVESPAALIDERLAFHEERAARILELLRPGPRSAHEIAKEIWGDVATAQAYLTTCEVLGHLDILATRDLVVEDASGPVRRFHAL